MAAAGFARIRMQVEFGKVARVPLSCSAWIDKSQGDMSEGM